MAYQGEKALPLIGKPSGSAAIHACKEPVDASETALGLELAS